MSSFTSDLSLDELVLVEEAGFEPLDLVIGSCHWHIGVQWGSWSQNQELDQLTRAMHDARDHAMRRLQEQLVASRADGVVGMRLEIEHHHHHAQFVAVGTAVRRRFGDGQAWRVRGAPFTSDLTGQDFFALVRAGWRPCRLVYGNCVYHVAHQGLLSWFKTVGNNVEMENFTQALYDARELAMERMQAEAVAAGASGVVGVKVHEGRYGWASHVVEYSAVGTAIAPIGAEPPRPAPPQLVLDLRD